MGCTPSPPSPEQLALLSRTVREIARSRGLSPENAQDFEQSVHLRLLQRRYDIFDRFAGRSSLRTYLTVVVHRMLLDWQNAAYGKWRPSAAAVKSGEHAVGLDRLIHRDGYTTDEAIRICCAQRSAPSETELRRLAQQLPQHQRRRMVSEDALDAAPGATFEDPIDAEERRRSGWRIRRALSKAFRQLPSEDQRLIDLRYRQGHSVQAIAHLLQADPKSLYRRFDRALRSLHRTLEAAGVTAPDAIDHRPAGRPASRRSRVTTAFANGTSQVRLGAPSDNELGSGAGSV
jgi:RNA polymerase sigma factor (sigma-70 family)